MPALRIVPSVSGAPVNIYLIPYTFYRHFAVGLVCGGAAFLAWWIALAFSTLAPFWDPRLDGAVFLGLVAGMVAGASLLAEGTLRRTALWRRVLFSGGAMGITAAGVVLSQWLWAYFVGAYVFGENLGDPSLTSLRTRLPMWVAAGMLCAISTIPFRKFKGIFPHLFGGWIAGLAGAAAWQVTGYSQFQIANDLYLAGAAGALMLGFSFGTFAWGVPDELYAGWLRVVTETRHARRIPIDTNGTEIRERFVGHFPRGLDLFLPANEGVMELHLSVLATKDFVYKARGLTLQPTVVRRFLERVDLRYDARRPTPLETKLSSGDRLVLGPAGNQTVVEFLMLPREEQ